MLWFPLMALLFINRWSQYT
ncbi:hypothetical protein OCT59_018875 [Rhizophagus irregularis]|nr:hypothetical protein OCT59_018875 [Rhizophagus irregularis]